MGGLLTLSGLGDSALSLPFFFTPSLSLFLPFSESFFLEGSFSGPRMEEGKVGTHHLSLRNRKQTTVPFLSRLVERLGGPRSGCVCPSPPTLPVRRRGPCSWNTGLPPNLIVEWSGGKRHLFMQQTFVKP